MCKLMCESLEEDSTKFSIECAAALANNLVAATMRVEEVRHADIEADNLHHIITVAKGPASPRRC